MISILLYMSPIFNHIASILYHMILISSGMTFQKLLESKSFFNSLGLVPRACKIKFQLNTSTVNPHPWTHRYMFLDLFLYVGVPGAHDDA